MAQQQQQQQNDQPEHPVDTRMGELLAALIDRFVAKIAENPTAAPAGAGDFVAALKIGLQGPAARAAVSEAGAAIDRLHEQAMDEVL